jgi:ribose-phosphate pyrophosphokinase
MPVQIEYLKENAPSDLVVVAPDAGRVKVAERFSQQLGCDIAIVHKRRPTRSANEVEALALVGQVHDRVCVLIDDIIDTAGTVCAGADLLAAHGASDVWAMATHGVLSGPALDRLKASVISRIVITNTLPIGPDRMIDKIEVLSVAAIIAEAIDAVFEDSSVSEIFGGHNQG